MKKLLILAGLLILVISGCSPKTVVKDLEAHCAAFGKICPQNETRCRVCGVTKASSYASCHSEEFCKNAPLVDNHQNKNVLETDLIKAVVQSFGKKIQEIPLGQLAENSLPSGRDNVIAAIQKNYAEFISSDLLANWLADPDKAPGRELSSPWPDEINQLVLTKIDGRDEYKVGGYLIWRTSEGVAKEDQVSLTVIKEAEKWVISEYKTGADYHYS